MNKDLADMEAMQFLGEYVEHFNEYYQLLIERYSRFKELREEKGYTLDTETYLDMIIVQLRALLLENKPKKGWSGNYSVENILMLEENEKSKEEAKDRIRLMLESVMIKSSTKCDKCLVAYDCEEQKSDCPVKEDLLVSKAIKILADKTLCHYDNMQIRNCYSWDCIQMIKQMFYNPDEEVNVDYVIGVLQSVFHAGVIID